MKRVIEYRQLVQILILFMIVQFLGLTVAVLFYNTVPISIVSSALSAPTSIGVTIANVLFYIGMIVVFSFILIIFSKRSSSGKFFYFVEAYILFISTFFIFWVISRLVTNAPLFSIFGNSITTSVVIAALLSVALIIAKNKWQKLRNSAAILASAGVGTLLGISLPFYFAFIFMAFLAVYDFIAVFITKHMITMAKAVSEKNLAFLIGVNEVEAVSRSDFSSNELKEYNKEKKLFAKQHTHEAKHIEALAGKGMVPVIARVELGTGDLVMPLMVAVSAFPNIKLSFFIIFGAIFGLVLTMMILKKYKRALPAIPPLLFGISVGIGIYYLLHLSALIL